LLNSFLSVFAMIIGISIFICGIVTAIVINCLFSKGYSFLDKSKPIVRTARASLITMIVLLALALIIL
jgi:hypothetical protein